MKLIDRAKNIIVNPKAEWDVIAAENTPPAQVITGYVLPLAAIAYVAVFLLVTLVFGMLFGARTGFFAGLASMIYNIVMAAVSVLLIALIIDALAPSFGGQKSFAQAVKAAAYPFTPVWIALILLFIPLLGALLVLAAVVYAIYIMYLGLPKLMRVPQEKAIGYLIVVIVCAIVLSFAVNYIAGIFTPGAVTLGGGSAATVQRESAMAKLDELGKQVEAANRKMEAAQKSGDPGKQAEAAMAALGTALSGGKGVEPVTLDKLTPLVPEKFAGLARTDMRTDRSGVAGLMVAKAEATYGSGEKNVELEVVDTGGAAGLMGLASWMGVQGEREDAGRREVTRKEGNRLVHEAVAKQGGTNKYAVVVGERFVVSAEGNGVDIGTLKSGVNSVNLAALEALK